MAGIVLPVHNLSHEERRNVILRLRFGPQPQNSRSAPQGKLRVVGQKVVHSPRLDGTEQFQTLMNSRKLNLTSKPAGMLGKSSIASRIVIPEYQADVSVEGNSGAKAPPTTPHGVELNSGTYDPDKFNERGERAQLQRPNFNQNGSKATTSASGGDIGGKSMKQTGRNDEEGRDVEKDSAKTYGPYQRQNLSQHGSDVTGWPTAEDGGPAVSVTKAGRTPLDDASEPVKRKGTTARNETRAPILRRSSSPHMRHATDARRQSEEKSSVKIMRRRRSTIIKLKGGDNTKRSQNKENTKEEKVTVRPSRDELQDLEVTTIRKFHEMPESKPKKVCFDHPGVNLTYLDVKQAIENVIPDAFETNKVVSVQFENINVKLGTGNKDNRWHIELCDFATRNKLIKSGLTLKCNKPPENDSDVITTSSCRLPSYHASKVEVKLYDMVMMEEYKLYLRRNAAEEKLQNVILLCAGRGQNLLSNML